MSSSSSLDLTTRTYPCFPRRPILPDILSYIARIMCPDGEGPGFVADKVGVEGADGKMLGPLVFLGNLIPSSLIFVAKNPLPSFLG
jgi:hypothetical protein